MTTDTPCRFLRFISMAAVIVAASGILGATGQPLYAAVGDATLQWGAANSEREKEIPDREVATAPVGRTSDTQKRIRCEPSDVPSVSLPATVRDSRRHAPGRPGGP